MRPTRRTFLATAATAAAAMACRPDPSTNGPADTVPGTSEPTPTGDTGLPNPTTMGCDGDVMLGTLLRVLPFLDEDPRTLETLTGEGLDARWVLDLTALTTDDLVLPQDKLFVRTAAPTSLGNGEDWTIRLHGAIDDEVVVDIDALLAQTADVGPVHFECSGNTSYGGFGLQGAVQLAGVPFSWLIDQVSTTPQGRRILVRGLDDHPAPKGTSSPGASWVFRPEDLQNAVLVTHIGGERLSPDHGYPVRLLIPGWYGCVNIKWLTEVEWVDDDAPATGQMQEFASRTMQNGTPALARDYAPALIDTAAAPIRVEVWELDGEERVRVVGLVWGGEQLPTTLRLWANGDDVGEVEVCPERPGATTWGLWYLLLPAGVTGRQELTLTVDDAGVQTRRLDDGYYARTVRV